MAATRQSVAATKRQSVAVELAEDAVAATVPAVSPYQEDIEKSLEKLDAKKTLMLIDRYKKRVAEPNENFWKELTEKLEKLQESYDRKEREYADSILDYLRGLNDFDEGDEPEPEKKEEEKDDEGDDDDAIPNEEEEEKAEEEEPPWTSPVHLQVTAADKETVNADAELQLFTSGSFILFQNTNGAKKSSPPFPIKHYISDQPLVPGDDPKLEVAWDEIDIIGSATDRKFLLTFKDPEGLEAFQQRYQEVAKQLKPLVVSNRRASQAAQNAFVIPKKARKKFRIVAKAVKKPVPTCTYRVNPDYLRQPFWRCLSCNPEDFICVICIHHCHRGHNVQFDADYSELHAFCDCGGASADCKARKHEDDSVPDVKISDLRAKVNELQNEVVRNTTLRTGRGEFFFWDSLLFYITATINREFCARLQAELNNGDLETKTHVKNAIFCFIQAVKEAHSLWKEKNEDSDKKPVASAFIDSEARVTASLVKLQELFAEQPTVWDYSYFCYHVKPPPKRYLPFWTSYPDVPLQGGRSEDIVFWRRFFQDAERVSVSRLADALFCHIYIVEGQPLDYEQFTDLVKEVGFPKLKGVDHDAWLSFLQKFGPTLNVVYKHLTGCATFFGTRSDWLALPGDPARDPSDPAKVRMEDNKFVLLHDGKEEEILLNVAGYYLDSSPGSYETVRDLVAKRYTDFRLRFEAESWETKIDPADRVLVEDRLDSFVNQSEKIFSRVLLIEKELKDFQPSEELGTDFWSELQKRWKENKFFGLKTRPAKIPHETVLALLEMAIKLDTFELEQHLSPLLEALLLAVWELPSDQRTFMGCMDSLEALSNLSINDYGDWFSDFLKNIAITTMRGVYQHIKRLDREWLENFDQVCKGFGKMCSAHAQFRQLAAKYPLLSAVVLATKNEVIEHWPLIKVASLVRGVREMVDYSDDSSDATITETGIAVLIDHGVLRSFVNSVTFHRWLARKKKDEEEDTYEDTWPSLLQTLVKEVFTLISLALHSQYRSLLLVDNGEWFFPFLVSINAKAPVDVLRVYFPVLLFVDNIDLNELEYGSMDDIRQHAKDLRKESADEKLELQLSQYKVVDVYFRQQEKLVPCVFQHDGTVSKNTTFIAQAKQIPFQVDPSKGGELRQANVVEPLVQASDMYCHQYNLNMGRGCIRIVADYDQLWSTMTTLLICALNGLAVATIHKTEGEPTQISTLPKVLMYILGATHVASAFLMMFAYFLDYFGFRDACVERIYWVEHPDDEKKLSAFERFKRRMVKNSKYWQVLAFRGFAAQICYFCFSIVGLFWPFGYCFALILAIFLFTKTAEELLEAIGLAVVRVLGAIMLGVTVIYFFAVIAYVGSFNAGYQFSDGAIKWDTLIWTVLGHFDLGLRSGPVFDYTTPGPSRTFGQFFFAFIYYFLVVLVLSAIMGGIIVDAFSQIRSKLESQKEAKDSSCLICGVQLTDAKFPFKEHVHTRHAFSNYVDLFAVVTLPYICYPGDNNGVVHSPIRRLLEEAVAYGEPEGDVLPSWNLHSDQLGSDRLMLNLKDERKAIEESRDKPQWDVALPIKFGTTKA